MSMKGQRDKTIKSTRMLLLNLLNRFKLQKKYLIFGLCLEPLQDFFRTTAKLQFLKNILLQFITSQLLRI